MRAFRVFCSGVVVSSGFGSLTFSKPSVVRFVDNIAETDSGVRCVSVRGKAHCFIAPFLTMFAEALSVIPASFNAHPTFHRLGVLVVFTRSTEDLCYI